MLDDLLLGEVTLTDDSGREERYRVLRVVEMQGHHYVLLQSLETPGEEPLIFRVEGDVEAEDASLVGIDDDDEWEAVAEAFDTLLFGPDDEG